MAGFDISGDNGLFLLKPDMNRTHFSRFMMQIYRKKSIIKEEVDKKTLVRLYFRRSDSVFPPWLRYDSRIGITKT